MILRDGRDSLEAGDRSNEKMFLKYVTQELEMMK